MVIKKNRLIFFTLFILLTSTPGYAFGFETGKATAEKKTESHAQPNENSEPLEPTEDVPSFFERRMTFEKISDFNPFSVSPHKQNYLLPLTYNSSPNGAAYRSLTGDRIQKAEIKFQLSLKILMIRNLFGDNGHFAFAYTQTSFWQAYQFHHSSPFRETNHEAEFMLSFVRDASMWTLKNKMLTLGFSHQSNGRAGIFSRSWNRIYVDFLFEKGYFLLGIKPWLRIPDRTEEDDNPDIEKYYGYGRVFVLYQRDNPAAQ